MLSRIAESLFWIGRYIERSDGTARILDVTADALTIESTGNAEKHRAMLEILEPYGVKEIVKSGMVAISRGGRSITDRGGRH